MTEPVVVEVLARPTLHRDRGIKLDVHRSLPTPMQIVFVYQVQMRVARHSRVSEGWTLAESARPRDRLDLTALGFSIDLEALFLEVPALRPVERGRHG